jgi:hypothetical protein
MTPLKNDVENYTLNIILTDKHISPLSQSYQVKLEVFEVKTQT